MVKVMIQIIFSFICVVSGQLFYNALSKVDPFFDSGILEVLILIGTFLLAFNYCTENFFFIKLKYRLISLLLLALFFIISVIFYLSIGGDAWSR